MSEERTSVFAGIVLQPGEEITEKTIEELSNNREEGEDDE